VRRKGREAALQLLYQIEFSADPSPRAFEEFWGSRSGREHPERPFAETLVHAVLDRRTEIDALIDSAADNWQLDRIARMDLNVLRIAVAEMTGTDPLPPEIVMDEAVEIARKYCDAGAPAFVNGVLDRVARDLRRDAVRPREER
jgi:transcription antitermination protein NusB